MNLKGNLCCKAVKRKALKGWEREGCMRRLHVFFKVLLLLPKRITGFFPKIFLKSITREERNWGDGGEGVEKELNF